MHELSVCQALIVELESIASQHPDSQVSCINLKLGPLSGVEAQLLENAFPFASAGTVAEAALLNIVASEIVVFCSHCNKNSKVKSNRLVCSFCGDWKTQLVSGDELLLERVEFEKNHSISEGV